MQQNLNASKLSVAVARAGTTGFQVDTSNDHTLFNEESYSWDDMSTLKNELGAGVLEFVGQVHSITQNPEIILNLGGQVKHFTATIELFFREINDFSERVRLNRILHETKTGRVNNMDDFSLYNRVAMTYHTLCNELAILITPIMSELMIIVSKAVDNARLAQPQPTEVAQTHE